jgi:hypothetical protein
LEHADALTYIGSDVCEGRHASAVGTLVVAREATADVDHGHFCHTDLIGGLKEFGGMIKGNCVRVEVTTA